MNAQPSSSFNELKNRKMSENQTPTESLKRFKTSRSGTFGMHMTQANQPKINLGAEIAKMTIFGSSVDV